MAKVVCAVEVVYIGTVGIACVEIVVWISFGSAGDVVVWISFGSAGDVVVVLGRKTK